MLKELRIKDFAIIENLLVEFTEGLNLLTGETGSGKSIIIEALEMVLGGRASKDMVRSGKEKAIVEAMFFLDEELREDLKDMGYETDGVLVLTKEISERYPSVSRINGRPVTLNILKNVTAKLVDIFGQHEHQSLLDTGNHMIIIDSLLDRKGKELLDQVYGEYELYKGLVEKKKKLSVSSQERERELDLLNFQIEEIDNANLKEGDDQEIEMEFKRLDNLKETIAQSLQALTLLKDEFGEASVIDLLQRAGEIIAQGGRYDKELKEYGKTLQGITYELEDLYREMAAYVENLDVDQEALFVLRERLDIVNSLKKKYGNSVNQILDYRNEIESRHQSLQNLDQELQEVEREIQKIKDSLLQRSELLGKMRRSLAESLEEKMERELSSLNMDNIRFKVHFKTKEEPSSKGMDQIEFLISTNPGEDLKPLAKIVSGGEMSRIMLAFKGILADKDNMPTLVFDEIDTGISGRTAQVVGEKIKRISKGHQVISISHLPQIAALADTHFAIRKDSQRERTITRVEKLTEGDRIEELARILGGVEVTETTRRHAEEMLLMSNKVKK